MDIESLMQGPVPGDFTLDQLTRYFMTVPEMRAIIAQSKYSDRVNIRYVIRRPGQDEADAPGTMLLTEFRELAGRGLGFIVISDSDGGVSEPSPYPAPLVDA